MVHQGNKTAIETSIVLSSHIANFYTDHHLWMIQFIPLRAQVLTGLGLAWYLQSETLK